VTPPHREYWRVWSDTEQRWHARLSREPVAYARIEPAQREARCLNEYHARCGGPTDWRPVHCREVVIDG
jgi:hypothetical protein